MKLIDETTAEQSRSFPVALVVSQFNRDVTAELKKGAIERLLQSGFHDHDLLIVEVPGAVEIPLLAKRLAAKGQVEAIIALGAVIRGETTHYDYVCEQVSNGCQQVALEYDLPIIFGVLTTENEEQAWDRLGGRHGHKGRDAADCAIAMHTILKQL
ncbi:6,7-dimethyl-8-ribityllumazine synthase [Legionella erythra]|uniref:6,7-dimethyl-8-ribityllumazine synthase n=1 Tax=Legionella erythra TaxID=448 RepID=A0A0W0TQU9_LEGER|nr:6,7-dimethyl-8-ribityllumazine synthase [Legionella erythra]KTC97932.1 riboflavin synthase beta chain (6,7-dimethyl-8-ribityllumazine synthase) [Legionella erythra]